MQSEGLRSDMIHTQNFWSSDISFIELNLHDSSDAESETSPCIKIDLSSPQIDSSLAIQVVQPAKFYTTPQHQTH